MKWLARKPDKLSKAEKEAIVGDFHKKNEEFWKKNDEKAGSPIKTKKIKRVVEVKPKPNGKYEMPKFNFDSFDWDLWLREKDPNYLTLEDEDKLVSQPSIDESNATWWNNMYYDYKRGGGELNFNDFKKMLLREGDIGDLDAKNKKLEGIRKILIA